MDLDPIKQLQSLLEDRGKVLEKISSIQSDLKSPGTESSAPEPAARPAPVDEPQTAANSFTDDRVYGRLLQALRDMQAQIEHRVRPLAQQAVEFEVARLREQSGQHRGTLDACLAQVDQCLLNCVAQLDEYQKKHTFLITLNHRIANLGATPEPLPDSLSMQNLDAAIQARVARLRRQV